MQNPYTLTFGKEPIEYIKRIAEERQILEDFLSPNPPQQVYMISGVRGCGKTVFMTDISQEIGRDEDWIVVDLNPYKADLMQEAAAYLSSIQGLAQIFQKAKLNFSLFGFGLEVSDAAPIADIQVALERMIENLAQHHKKILFTIDDVTASPQGIYLCCSANAAQKFACIFTDDGSVSEYFGSSKREESDIFVPCAQNYSFSAEHRSHGR